MNDSLRYDIKKDSFRCTICGRSAADGIRLHVDHTMPVEKGDLIMARRYRKNQANGIGGLIILLIGFIGVVVDAVVNFISENREAFIIGGIIIMLIVIITLVANGIIKRQRRILLNDILEYLHLEDIDNLLPDYDDRIIVKSRQTLNNYDDIKYLKEYECFDDVWNISDTRKRVRRSIETFLAENDFQIRHQYAYIASILNDYLVLADGYRVLVVYITSAGNNKGQRLIHLTSRRIDEIDAHPEYLMTKGEYNKLLKQQAKEELDAKKRDFYNHVNSIIDYANMSKDNLIVKSKSKSLDDLVQKLFDRTVNSIQKVKQIDSSEWDMLENFIINTENDVRKIVLDDKRISDYYQSEDFEQIKETCKLLTQSRKEFNEYIDEKAKSISKLFGTRVVRNETEHDDVYNYIRAYKKSITPFTAEVSSAVFGSAENNPIGYIIKYFYPDKSQYKEQIQKLKVLIEELETLKEAKIIIDNYKKEYNQYIQNVPDYVLDNDEDGFYSRLGLAVIDEAILNVEYRFTYTSDGGMAQRSFTVPMNEENIIELINSLESKLSMEALAKEQRAMMTSKLRMQIKERDNYTCCQCGNSVYAEPNLLLEVDHIVPIARGGLTRVDNLQTLCWKCNRSKGAKIGL
ncbi:MAG: HNH endonuclease [Pseudobutyrivibrio sp.]|nr:HNH endonuclease [Pseudobutyrivibrio sp.]